VTDVGPPVRFAGVVRWTARAYVLVAAGAGLAALAVALGDPVPLFAAIPLLVVPFVAGAQVARQVPRADLTWEAGGSGPEVAIEGRFRGPVGDSGVELEVDVPRPHGAREVAPTRVETTADGVRFTARWAMAEPSVLTLPPPRIVARDPLGLLERSPEGTRSTLRLERYPPALQHIGSIRLGRTTTLPGEIRSPLRGSSGEFYGVRETAPDEPTRSVNWRATARAGRLLSNDFRVDRTGDLVLVLDVRPTSLGPEYDDRLLGVARAAAHGIAESFLRSKTRIGLASFGEFLTTLPLGTGRIHRIRLLRAIDAARREDAAGPAMRCAVGLRRFYPRGVTILVVSSWTEDPAFNLVPYVRHQGFPVVLLSPSPLPMRAGTGGLDPADEPLAQRLEQFERRLRLAPMWLHGPVVDWSDFWDLEPLARILRRPVYGRRG
jgi:uncharacterized protein (DUF58 family)